MDPNLPSPNVTGDTFDTDAIDRRRAAEMLEQVRRDLAELEDQVAAGEIDQETAAGLRTTYLAELAAAEEALVEAGREVGTESPDRRGGRSPRRMIAGALILVIGAGLAVGSVGFFARDPGSDALQGVAAAGADFDPSQYSNEALEAVIRAYANDPAVADQLRFMRFRLAERYFQEGDFRKAFPHYQAILESDPPPELASAVLTRLGWIVWVGNGETELGLGLLDRALEADPSNLEALYVKAQLTWCGLGDAAGAVPLLEKVASSSELEDAVRAQVESDLAAARAGKGC